MAIKLLIAAAGVLAYRTRQPAREKTVPAPMVAGASTLLPLKSAPIRPEWILSGTPVARVGDHSESGDRASMTAVWDCTAGEFNWFYEWDETVVIQEGEVHIVAEDGSERTLRAGDIAYFRGGTWARWHIAEYVRKIAFVRRPFPTPLAFAYRVQSAINRRLGGKQGGFAA